MNVLAPGGRLCLLNAPSGGELRIEDIEFYRRALRISGLNTLTYDSVRAVKILCKVGPVGSG
ncbi:hypothetical protein [Amycolatopsis pigmentata]|uniref:Uncharacterized protein n=1 Tax=Amycolatopsis pigmentata TaxID=450801 RepID=A0ABW5FIR0_9PSEU